MGNLLRGYQSDCSRLFFSHDVSWISPGCNVVWFWQVSAGIRFLFCGLRLVMLLMFLLIERGHLRLSLSFLWGLGELGFIQIGSPLGLFRLLWSSVAGIFQRLGDQEDPLFFYCGCVQLCSIVAVGLEKMARITLKMILQHWLNIEWWHSAAIVLMGSKPFFGMHFIHQQLHLKNPNTWDAQAIGILSCSCNNIIYSMNLVFNMLKVIRTPSPGT